MHEVPCHRSSIPSSSLSSPYASIPILAVTVGNRSRTSRKVSHGLPHVLVFAVVSLLSLVCPLLCLYYSSCNFYSRGVQVELCSRPISHLLACPEIPPTLAAPHRRPLPASPTSCLTHFLPHLLHHIRPSMHATTPIRHVRRPLHTLAPEGPLPYRDPFPQTITVTLCALDASLCSTCQL